MTPPFRPTLVRAAALLALASLPVGSALACSCIPLGSPIEERDRNWSSAVFRGRVVQVEARGEHRNHVTFEVSTIWKGRRDPLHLVRTPGNGAMCGVSFQAGQEYVVYEHVNGEVYMCCRTRRVTEAAADLAALGPGQPPMADSLSRVSRYAHLSGSWYNPQRSGEGFLIETLDDARGVVTFFGYDPNDAQRQLWLTGVGTFDGDTLRVEELMRPHRGGFVELFRADRVERPVWGSVYLKLGPDGTGTANLHYRAAFSDRFSVSIQRLTRPPAPPRPAQLQETRRDRGARRAAIAARLERAREGARS